MRVVFNGIPYFTSKFVQELKDFDSKNNYSFYNTFENKWDQLKLVLNIGRADLFISFLGVTSRSGALDKVIQKKIPVMMFWHGTDVLKASERAKSGELYRGYIDKARHFTDAKWLKDELEVLGIKAEILPFKTIDVRNDRPSNYSELQVLSYLGEGREEFYGLSYLVSIARSNPDLTIRIVGSGGSDLDVPKNIKFEGYVNKERMQELMQSIPIFVRATEHDGNALSVAEALGNGMEVLWNNKSEKCHFFSDETELIEQIQKVSQLVLNRGMISSSVNVEFVKQNFNKDVVLSNFIKRIQEIGK